MNDRMIQQVINYEKQGREIYESAVKEAEQLPIKAEQEAQALIERARGEAQAEARRLVAEAQSGKETSHVMAEVESKSKQIEATAKKNFDEAVKYILDSVVGGK